jgi:hypothetical protein
MLAARAVHPGRSSPPHRLCAAPAAVALHKWRVSKQSRGFRGAPGDLARTMCTTCTLLAMRRTAEQLPLTFVDGSSRGNGC